MHLEIRIVGRNKKYYLAHSMRQEDKIKKLRFYLGANLSVSELEEAKRRAETVLKERITAYEAVGDPFHSAIKPEEMGYLKDLEKRYKLEEIKVLHLTDRNWAEFTKAFAYDTNAIEGSTVTFKEVSGILERDEWPKERQKWEVSETYGVAEAIEFIRKTEEHISLELIKELHRIVFKNSKEFAGRLRERGMEVAVVDVFGNVMHRGAPSSQVTNLLQELVKWYNDNKRKYPPLVLAVVAHNHFETIHPFQDGNGRVGRLLLNNILLKHGLPPVNIELGHRQRYYRALREYQNNMNIRPMIELVLREYRKLKKILKR